MNRNKEIKNWNNWNFKIEYYEILLLKIYHFIKNWIEKFKLKQSIKNLHDRACKYMYINFC